MITYPLRGGTTTRWFNDTCYHARTALAPPVKGMKA